MHIDSYSFGAMKVNGKLYTKDLIIFPNKISPNWWRREGHSLAIEDLEEVIHFNPDILIVGTGASGVMRLPRATEMALEERQIELFARLTGEAASLFNEQIESGRKVAGAFHLTC